MTNYEVKAEGGVDVNGTHYDQGHVFEFDAVPEYVQPLIDDGSILEVLSDEAKTEVESPKEEGADSSVGSDEANDSAQSTDAEQGDTGVASE